MKTKALKLVFSIYLSGAVVVEAAAQSEGEGMSRFVIFTLIALAVALVFAVVILVSDNLIRIKAREVGADTVRNNFSLLPTGKEIIRRKLPDYVNGSGVIILKKGYDIPLEGSIQEDTVQEKAVTTFAVQPPNFIGIAPIPKLMVEEGQSVEAGQPLFFDKSNPDIKYVAPVSGEVVAVNRGAKRSIAEVVILADKGDFKYRSLNAPDYRTASREELVEFLMDSGAWPLMRQRPFNVVPDPEKTPKGIFVSTFLTAPLAPDTNVLVAGREQAFQEGLNVLTRLSDGPVYLGLNAARGQTPSQAFLEAEGVEKRWFHGPHPVGNVGVQIHHIDGLNAGETVWTLGVQEVITLGTLFSESKFDATRIIGLAGAEVTQPKYIKTHLGANVGELLEGELKGEHVRIISGDVLSGSRKEKGGFLDCLANQLTVVEEGDYYEPFGWLNPFKAKPSISRAFPSRWIPGIKHEADTNTHGERRAFVVTGQYESVMPMDIYPQQLMKAILIQDFEDMEGLGIYELVEEDVALCEFVCTSKQPVQKILREGLDLMREQL